MDEDHGSLIESSIHSINRAVVRKSVSGSEALAVSATDKIDGLPDNNRSDVDIACRRDFSLESATQLDS